MRVVVPSFAKLNLDLRVLHRRTDGFHELRTIFQTIDLADELTLDWDPKQPAKLTLDSSIDIPDNLVAKAAQLVLAETGAAGALHLTLEKRIPMGAGLGGGSSNAAAVLLALPALIGNLLPQTALLAMAEALGSDVPFFLYGGTALGLGRGTELYPLPDAREHAAVVVASGIHVSTAEAYRNLNRTLTQGTDSPILREFQTVAWGLDRGNPAQLPLQNDFEQTVFQAHRELAELVRRLRESGAQTASMTGSGSAVFGLFPTDAAADAAAAHFPAHMAHSVRFITRQQYAQRWQVALEPAVSERQGERN